MSEAMSIQMCECDCGCDEQLSSDEEIDSQECDSCANGSHFVPGGPYDRDGEEF